MSCLSEDKLCKLHVTAIPMVNIDHCGKYKTSVSDV